MRPPRRTPSRARADRQQRRSQGFDRLQRLLSQSAFQSLPTAFIPHCLCVPLGVMVRGTMEWLLDPEAMELLLQESAPTQYTRELTIDSLVGLMIQVVAGQRASVFAAYAADIESESPTISTSFQAVYSKLGRIDPRLSEAVVRFVAAKLRPVLEALPKASDPVLPGYRTKILDGNVLAGTERRLKPLRQWLNACLPGKSLVILEPDLGLISDLVLCEDSYTQERVLTRSLLERVEKNDLLVFDRNFTTTAFLLGIARRAGFFVGRQHRSTVPVQSATKLKLCGKTDTGKVYEQKVHATDPATDAPLVLRRIEIRLLNQTRDGEKVIALLTNLPDTVSATVIAEIYRKRWTIETQFQFLTDSLHCEVPGLGKPRAALFAFAMSTVASNALTVVRGSLRAAHGRDAEAELSGYYLADELSSDYRTLAKYLPADEWTGWQELGARDLARLLTEIAQHVNLAALKKNPRGPKKPPVQKPTYNRKHQHFSTYRLLKEAKEPC
jgi:hypothetical protein